MPSTNEERTVLCPAVYPDGGICEHEVLARALHLHVRQKSDEAHGPHGEVPDALDLSEAPEAGTKSVTIDYPEEREKDATARQCPYCGNTFRGKQGVSIHFGQVVGRKNHPADRDEFPEPEETPIVRLDENENVVEVVDPGAMMPSTRDRLESQHNTETVQEFLARLRAMGRDEQANAVEDALEELGEKPEEAEC